MQHIDLLELWYAALRAEVGISIQTSDPKRLRERLYAARRAAEDEDLDTLFITLSPTSENSIWIMHKRILTNAEA